MRILLGELEHFCTHNSLLVASVGSCRYASVLGEDDMEEYKLLHISDKSEDVQYEVWIFKN
jgi:hypothetical protein